MSYWKPGTPVVTRGIVHNRVWIAYAGTVVQDTDDLLVTWMVPEAPCKVPRGLIARKWIAWRPDPAWGIPKLPALWDVVNPQS